MQKGKIASQFKFQNVRLPSKSVERRAHQHTARHSNSGTHRNRSKYMQLIEVRDGTNRKRPERAGR
jgi:hypothetical protein